MEKSIYTLACEAIDANLRYCSAVASGFSESSGGRQRLVEIHKAVLAICVESGIPVGRETIDMVSSMSDFNEGDIYFPSDDESFNMLRCDEMVY